MDLVSIILIVVGSVISVGFLGLLIFTLIRKFRGHYDIDSNLESQATKEREKVSVKKERQLTALEVKKMAKGDNFTEDDSNEGFIIEKREERIIDPVGENDEDDKKDFSALGLDALKGDIVGPWKSVVASIISANRGVSRNHLGYAPVTQVLNDISPSNQNVAINLDKDELEDFLGYVKVLEASLDNKTETVGMTPQQKYRMLQKAFEDKRDLDSTKEAREFSREIIRQEKLGKNQYVAEEQLAKLDKQVSEKVVEVVDEKPEAQKQINEFREDLRGDGLKSRKIKKRKVSLFKK